jgi:hypothetical protein
MKSQSLLKNQIFLNKNEEWKSLASRRDGGAKNLGWKPAP